RRDGLHLATLPRREQYDEAWQIFGISAQAVQDPRPHAGPSRNDGSGVHDGVGRVMIDLLGEHRANNADLVGDTADVRKQLGNLLAGLAEFLEAVLGAEADERLPLQLGDLLSLGEGLRHLLL